MIKQRLKRVTLRVMLLLAAVLAVTQAVSAYDFPSKLYFDLGGYAKTQPYKTVHFYNGGDSDEMTLQPVEGTNYYYVDAPSGCSTCEIFMSINTDGSKKIKMYGINASADPTLNMIVVKNWNTSGSEFEATSAYYSWTRYDANPDLSGTDAFAIYVNGDGPGGKNIGAPVGDDFKAEKLISTSPYTFHYSTTVRLAQNQVFRLVNSSSGAWFGPSTGDNVEVRNASSANTAGGSNRFKWVGDEADVTISFDYTVNGAPYNVTFSAAEPQITAPTFQLMAGTNNKVADFTVVPYDEANNIYKASVTYQFKSGDWFSVRMNGTTLFGPSANPYEITSLPFDYTALQQNSNSFKLNNGAKVTISFLYDASSLTNVPYSFTVVEASKLLTVLPARVRTWSDAAGWAEVTSEHPAIYLLGDVLNAERVTPEYEMLPNADYSEYVIEHFAMRKCDVYAVAYTSKDGSSITFGKQTVNPFEGTNFAEYAMTPGVDYRAVCRKVNGQWTLTLTPNSLDDPNAKNLPPYMSMVGYNFRQLTNEITPNVDGYNSLKYTDITAHSNTGWQEAWLQQDANGNLLRDINGRVMYNTMWPPKNQIFFNAVKVHKDGDKEVIDEEIELNSNNLTMAPYRVDGKVVIKKGSEWKAMLNGDDPSSDYYNLFHSAASDWAQTTNDNGRNWIESMNDNYYYARYVVPRVWILGATKIWTGWTGRIVSNDKWAGADWSAHSQWGYKYDTTNDNGNKITVNKPHPMQSDRGNFLFDQPTYFKSVEFFYCLGDNLNDNHDNTGSIFYSSLIYTTRSNGEPSIHARAYENRDGNYKMQLEAELSKDVTVTGIEIRRYSATQSTTEAWVPVNSNNQACSEQDALVKTWTGSWTQDQFNTSFNQWNLSERSDNNLAEGKYFYGMTLTFSDGKREEKIKSNPFTIVKTDVEVNPDVYQLCKLAEPKDGFDYVTYAESATEAYLVKVDGEEVKYEATSVPTVDEYLDATLMNWTDLMFVQSDVPAKFVSNNVKYDINKIRGYELSVNNATPSLIASGMDDAKSYAAVLKSAFVRDMNVELTLDYYLTVDDEGSSSEVKGECTPVVKKFTYTFPVPTFAATQSSVTIPGYANVTAPYAEGGNIANVFSISGSQGNEHELNVVVPVLAPNIADDVTIEIKSTVAADGNTWNYDGKENTSLRFKNQDPNKWINTADNSYAPIAHAVSLNTAEYNGCNQFPSEAEYTQKDVVIENNIEALNLGTIKLVNAILRCDEDGNIDPTSQANKYRAVLAVASAEIMQEDVEKNTIGSTSLAHHDDYSHYAFKAGKADAMELKAHDEDGFHHHSNVSDTSKLSVIAMSDTFHWYAEMDDELFNVEDYKVAIARAFFFTNEDSGVEFGGTSAQKAFFAPAASDADATHYTFLARFSEAKQLDRSDIMTSVDEVEADANSVVRSGKGWIEVMADEAKVYNAEGMLVGGAGRSELEPGVYVVRTAGKVSKVVVR